MAARVIPVYRRRVDLYSGSYRAAAWADYSFDELFAGEPAGVGPGGCRRAEAELPAVHVVPPPLSRLVERDVDRIARGRISRGPALRLSVPGQTDWGYDAEIAYRLATLGERGFAMAKRRHDGPTLFGEPDNHPEATAYPRPAVRPAPPPEPDPDPAPDEDPAAGCFAVSGRAIDDGDREALATIAKQVVDRHHRDLVERIKSLEDAIRRSLEQHRQALEHDEPGRYATARAILESALDWSPASHAKEAVA